MLIFTSKRYYTFEHMNTTIRLNSFKNELKNYKLQQNIQGLLS